MAENSDFNFQNLLNNKPTIAVAGLFLTGLFLLTFGAGLFFFQNESENDDIKIITADVAEIAESIIVHIDGAVVEPGVYDMESTSRVNDLVVRAGGLTNDFDPKQLNLAAKITDGQKIYLPRIGESNIGSSVAGESTSGPININTASESLLDTLPGVGPVTANKIISARTLCNC